MLLYEYKCPECFLRFENWADMKDDKNPPCPSCKTASPRHYGQMSYSFKGGSPTKESFDTRIGRESELRREEIAAQVAERNKIRKEANESFLVTNGAGEYRASTPAEKESTRQALNAGEKIKSITED